MEIRDGGCYGDTFAALLSSHLFVVNTKKDGIDGDASKCVGDFVITPVHVPEL